MAYQPIIQQFPHNLPQLPPVDWKNGVLLRSTNWLGDIMMTLPATWQLKKHLPPGTPLWVLSPSPLSPVWKAAPWIDGVISMGSHHIGKAEIQTVKSHGFGMGIVLPNSFGSAMDLWRCKIPRRYGRGGNLRTWMLTDHIHRWSSDEFTGRCHQLSWYLQLMQCLVPVEYTTECPQLKVDTTFAEECGITAGERWLALAPGANFGPAKEWPLENYQLIAQRWIDDGGKVLVTGTKREQLLTWQLVKHLPPDQTLDMTGKTTLNQLMALFAAVDVMVANDSGSMHLAAALGTPGIALFASTDPVATGPLGAPWETLAAEVNCRPCFQRSCPWEGARKYQCMNALSPQRVWESLEKVSREVFK